MADQTQRILDEALALPTRERAHLAAELMASVDGEPDPDAQAAWLVELDRRVRRVQAEGPSGADWQDVHARIAAQLHPTSK